MKYESPKVNNAEVAGCWVTPFKGAVFTYCVAGPLVAV